jgi:hypothetical protein
MGMLAKTSQDTALRDIDNLLQHGVLVKDAGGGRSTSYSLVETGQTDVSQSDTGRYSSTSPG